MSTFVVNVNGVEVKTTVTDTMSFEDNLVADLLFSLNYRVAFRPIGFDVKFTRTDDLTDWWPSLLQLSAGSRCVIVQLHPSCVIPQCLSNFLSSPSSCFAGIEVRPKLSALKREYGIEFKNVVELQPVVDIAALCGCLKLDQKPVNMSMSGWRPLQLNIDQIQTAATDAFSFFQLANIFSS